ncbi:PREDICTED: MICAL-like protein 2 isoform X1 [Crocodylus porosus]|uniref:MICAL like 2 n=2 Tax=Crocodylus porosus TaxID=8502 RepID=A0A7M4G225_CROPO|nr:PREDICTED: MICAL-like protein 2 isoform X1 [Crocodylus porosus]
MAAIKNLQLWCKQQCEGYRDVSITNMTTSFRDGLAFCAILHRHRPELLNFNSLSKENVYENNKLAFQVAEEQLGIPALLDAEDMVALKVPDRLSILTYVSQYYNYFHGRSPIGGLSGIKRPSSEVSGDPAGKKVISEPVKPAPAKPSRAYPPPTPKTGPAVPGQDLPKENPPVTAKRVLADSSNVRSSSCAICGDHVHLVQRYLVDGKLYHRNCFRCKQCSNTLLSGAYKSGTEPGTYICTSHQQPARSTGYNPAISASDASGAFQKAVDSKKPAQASAQTSQASKDTAFTSDSASSTKPFAGSSSGFRSLNAPQSPPAGNKPDQRESAVSPSWTSVAAKTQQAREKFFQSGLGDSGPSISKAPAAKDQVVNSPPSSAGGKAAFSKNFSDVPGGSSEKDKARSFLRQALPGSDASTNRPGGVTTAGSQAPSSVKHSSIASRWLSPDPKVQGNKMGPTGLRSAAIPEPAPRSPANKLGGEAAARPERKGWMGSKPADFGRNPDGKSTKGIVDNTEDKSESPADWRTRLKPVSNKASDQGVHKKPTDTSNVFNTAVSLAQKETKPASSVISPANQNNAPSAALPQKKKLYPSQELSISWQTPKQKWEEPVTPAKEEESGHSKRVMAPVKLSVPQSFPENEPVSPTKLHPDYIPEEEIQEKVRDIEKQLDELEQQGVDLEKQLRSCEGDESEDALMVDWFKLIHEKQLLLRLESELMYKMKQQKLEEKQWNTENELRCLMSKPEDLKTPWEKAREEELLESYVRIVNDRNDIVDCLDEDRIREQEEDQVLADMIQKLDGPRDGLGMDKRKNRFRWSKIWKQKNKNRAKE